MCQFVKSDNKDYWSSSPIVEFPTHNAGGKTFQKNQKKKKVVSEVSFSNSLTFHICEAPKLMFEKRRLKLKILKFCKNFTCGPSHTCSSYH